MTGSTEGVARAPRAPRVAREQYLDVLRAFSVLLVIFRHSWPNAVTGVGAVAITFTLSGWVISRVLDRDLQRFGRPRFGRFYVHRAFRLQFALILVVVTYTVVTLVWYPETSIRHIVGAAVASQFYLFDIPVVHAAVPQLSHLWNVSVDEQFYLVWPLLLWVAFRFTRRLGLVAIVAAVLCTVACLIVLSRAAYPGEVYILPTTWASSIAIGAAGYFYRDQIRRLIGRHASLLALIALLIVLAGLFYPNGKNQELTYIAGPALVGLCSVVMINWATAEGNHEVRVPAVRPLVWLGRISYGAYVWNLPMTDWFNAVFPGQVWWVKLVIIPLTIVPAIISWYTVERFGRYLTRRYDERARLRVAAAAATVTAAAATPAPASEPT